MNSTELRINRLNTAAFIAADPVTLVLYRRVEVPTPSGGKKFKRAETPEDPQVFRLIPIGTENAQRLAEVSNATGRVSTPLLTILGEWDANIQQYDEFELNGAWYQVSSTIRPEHSVTSVYEIKADITRREDG